MTTAEDRFQADIDNINRITIVPTMLEVICRATGMGFSAIARVTDERWIACSVRDEINFGLKPGGELELKTTICDEIRQSRQGVVIDNVATDANFCDHHTPKKYGLQSYISMPIILNNGEFFGTLCAIDPNPAMVSDVKTVGMFTLFAQLIAFHLQALDALEMTTGRLKNASDLLSVAVSENQRYEHITYHSLREPVRKISMYSEMLLTEAERPDLPKIKSAASNIARCSLQLAGMLQQLKTEDNSISSVPDGVYIPQK